MPVPSQPPAALDALDDAQELRLYLLAISAASRASTPGMALEHLLRYLELLPLGAHNREIAERIEAYIEGLQGELRRIYQERYRRARDPYLPPLERIRS